jgi:hypothetical protein
MIIQEDLSLLGPTELNIWARVILDRGPRILNTIKRKTLHTSALFSI